jgi:nitrite reductase/ring-hydroxylating ferredoxin subunit/uncharacterized membrane protein
MATGVVQAIVDRQKWLDEVSDAVQPVINNAFSNAGEGGRVVKDFLNGVWLGHPLHPVLTDVPVGAWTMTTLLDLLSTARGGDDGLDRASDITLGAGIAAALAAAVTGIVDWSDIGGSHRRMGMAHALLNVGGLTLSLASLGLRLGGNKRSRGVARLLSAGGYAVTATSAYVAGELVFNLGQAINRNAWTSGPDNFTDLAPVGEIAADRMNHYDVDGEAVVVVRDEHGIHAFGGICSHYGCGLWEGKLEGHTVTCQCHGSQYDITTGDLIHGPATAPVPTYETRTVDGRLQVRMERAAGSQE